MLKLSLVLGTALSVLLPVAVQAQSYDLFPANECPGALIDYICHDEGNTGQPMLYAVPAGYDGRYMIFANKLPGGSLSLVYDLWNEQTAAYIFLGDSNRTNRPDAGGNVRLLEEMQPEMVDINVELSLY